MQGSLFSPELHTAMAQGQLSVPRVPIQCIQKQSRTAEEGHEEGIQRN